MGTVDTRLLSRWQASWRRERATRLLPASWLDDDRPEAKAASELGSRVSSTATTKQYAAPTC